MMIWNFQSPNQQFTRQVAIKTLLIGLVLIGLGMLILAVPQLVVIPLAVLFFIVGFFCLTSAWRLFWASAGAPRKPSGDEYEDARYREIP